MAGGTLLWSERGFPRKDTPMGNSIWRCSCGRAYSIFGMGGHMKGRPNSPRCQEHDPICLYDGSDGPRDVTAIALGRGPNTGAAPMPPGETPPDTPGLIDDATPVDPDGAPSDEDAEAMAARLNAERGIPVDLGQYAAPLPVSPLDRLPFSPNMPAGNFTVEPPPSPSQPSEIGEQVRLPVVARMMYDYWRSRGVSPQVTFSDWVWGVLKDYWETVCNLRFYVGPSEEVILGRSGEDGSPGARGNPARAAGRDRDAAA